MYKVVVVPTAQKSFNRLPKNIRDRIVTALRKLQETPRIGKPLKGEFAGKYSLRVWPYRIIYRVFEEQLLVEVIDIGHRQGVYK